MPGRKLRRTTFTGLRTAGICTGCGGAVSVSTLYVPVADSGELVSITSQIRFRRECETGEEEERNETGRESADAEISVELLSVSAKVINERKIRVRAEIRCTAKKYVQEETEFLEGVKDSELGLRKETDQVYRYRAAPYRHDGCQR